MSKTVAVTGGTGFVGAALIQTLIERGDKVKALARDAQRMAHFPDIAVIPGSLEDESALSSLAEGSDILIHCAGLTHARRDEEFFSVNVEGARRAAQAAARHRAKLVHISSLAARRPEVSAYAESKRKSEDAVAEGSGANPFIALRAPAIYGPGDAATLPYFKLVRSGLAPEPAAEPSPRASILYVGDVVAAILQAADEARENAIYEIGDDSPSGYSWGEIGQALGEAFGRPPARLPAPRWLLASYATCAAGISRMAGQAPMVTPGKIREFFHPDWVARDNLLADATSWRARTPLKEGFAKTVRWYQENGLL